MQPATRLSIFRDFVLAIASAAAILWLPAGVTRAPAAAPPRINGSYDLTGAGAGVLTGQAVVASQVVRVTGTLTDPAGNHLAFSATNLAMDRSTYRFKGTATIGTSTAVICGRLDPDDKTLKKCRITGTFLAADGTAGRFMGPHR